MRETSKAMHRRFREAATNVFPWKEIFKGEGIDVGSGDDPLDCAKDHFDAPDGSGDNLIHFFPDKIWDWIHGSNVLEHAVHPRLMLTSWVGCLRPNGYIIATVPDFELYEKKTWPSKFNAGHRSTWSMTLAESPAEIHIKLPEWLRQFGCEILRCQLVDTNYDYKNLDADQTFDPANGVECFIEFVLKKK